MGKIVWSPKKEHILSSLMWDFMLTVNKKYNIQLEGYDDLYSWTIENPQLFWDDIWQYCDIIHSFPYTQVVDDMTSMLGAKWFPSARLNFAENLLRFRDNKPALVFRREDKLERTLSYKDLFSLVAQTSSALKSAGVNSGDRVAGFIPNIPEAVIAMLAAASIGAVWSSSSPDFGIKGVLDRFSQIEPKVLFAAD